MTLDAGSTTVGSGTRVGRFRLDDLIARDVCGSVWRATDERLGRQVMLRIVQSNDPRIDSILTAACAASRVANHHVAQVLDVLVMPDALAIVSEWVEGVPLGELLATRLTPAAAVKLTSEVAAAVSAIHAAGTYHGRITPRCVVVGPNGDVKLCGHGIDAALWGTELGLDPVSADLAALGSILLACLTTKWPLHARDGLAAAPLVGGVVASPGQLVADVPASLDRICARALANIPDPRVSHSVAPVVNIAALLESLALIRNELASPRKGESRSGGVRLLRRLAGVVVGVGVAGALAAGGIGLVVATLPGAPGAPGAKPATSQTEWHAPPTPTAEQPRVHAERPEQVLPVAAVWELGATGDPSPASHTQTVRTSGPAAAVDASMVSAWRTRTYRKPAAIARDPAGLVIDLGQPAAVRSLDIGLLGDGADIAVAATTTPPTKPPAEGTLATIVGAATLTTLRVPRPVTARYLVIWFLRVPGGAQAYQGGITNVAVTGSPAITPEP